MGQWFLKSLDPDDPLHGQYNPEISEVVDLSAVALLEHASRQPDGRELNWRLHAFKQHFGQNNHFYHIYLWCHALERLLSRPWSHAAEELGSAEPCIEVKELLDAYIALGPPYQTFLDECPLLENYVNWHHKSSSPVLDADETSQQTLRRRNSGPS